MKRYGNPTAGVGMRVGNSGVTAGMPAAHGENWRSVGAQQELAGRALD